MRVGIVRNPCTQGPHVVLRDSHSSLSKGEVLVIRAANVQNQLVSCEAASCWFSHQSPTCPPHSGHNVAPTGPHSTEIVDAIFSSRASRPPNPAPNVSSICMSAGKTINRDHEVRESRSARQVETMRLSVVTRKPISPPGRLLTFHPVCNLSVCGAAWYSVRLPQCPFKKIASSNKPPAPLEAGGACNTPRSTKQGVT